MGVVVVVGVVTPAGVLMGVVEGVIVEMDDLE